MPNIFELPKTELAFTARPIATNPPTKKYFQMAARHMPLKYCTFPTLCMTGTSNKAYKECKYPPYLSVPVTPTTYPNPIPKVRLKDTENSTEMMALDSNSLMGKMVNSTSN